MGQICCICTAGPEREDDLEKLSKLMETGCIGFAENPSNIMVFKPLDIGLHQYSPRSNTRRKGYALKQYGTSFGEC